MTAPSIWPRPDAGGFSNDLRAFTHQWQQLATARGVELQALGQPLGHTLWAGQRPARQAGAPHLLLAAGFHGEEPAGPWGMLDWLGRAPDALLDQVHLSLLPLVNATGFAAGLRFNALGQNPNRGYGAHCGDDLPSAEGALLLQHAAWLLPAASDGLYCGHEDLEQSHTYLYTFEPGRPPGTFSRGLLDTAARFFTIAPDGLIDDCPVEDGLIHNRYDGSFEAWCCEQGTRRAVCAETPGQQPFDERVRAQSALMQRFLELCLPG